MGQVLDPHARTNRARETRVAEPWLPAARDGRPEEGQRLTPDALRTVEGQLPWEGLPPTPRHVAPRRACTSKGQCSAPTPAQPRKQHVGSRPRQPALRTGSRGRESA